MNDPYDVLDRLAEYLREFNFKTARDRNKLTVMAHPCEPDGKPSHNTQAVFVAYDPATGKLQYSREKYSRYHHLDNRLNGGWIGEYSEAVSLTIEILHPDSFPAVLRECMECDGGVWEIEELLLPPAKRPKLTAEEIERRAAEAIALGTR